MSIPTAEQSRRTRDLCYSLAQHLSNRKECRGAEYMLAIHDGNIVFSPNICVFPDRHTRKSGTELPVLDHVLRTHFPEANMVKDKFGSIRVCPDSFVSGIFRYSTSVNKRSRKWFRVISGGDQCFISRM